MKKTLLIMAAGLGSRFGGVKQMHGVGPNDEILMQYAIYDAVQAGFHQIVIVIKPGMRQDLRQRLGETDGTLFGVPIFYAEQRMDDVLCEGYDFSARVRPLGTVHALLCAREYLREGAFAVANADDYYGKQAFWKIVQEMDALQTPEQAAMVAYQLENTVSAHGSVTRGICEQEGEFLRAVHEVRGIYPSEGGTIYDENGNAYARGSLVSMNLWAFDCGVVAVMQALFAQFLQNMRADEEYVLSDAIDSCIQSGKLKIKVLQTSTQWFGMTYREDLPMVQASLRQMHDAEQYPQTLC